MVFFLSVVGSPELGLDAGFPLTGGPRVNPLARACTGQKSNGVFALAKRRLSFLRD
jgi:hypothetical protein